MTPFILKCGAQPPSAFVEVFNLAERDAATATAQSTV